MNVQTQTTSRDYFVPASEAAMRYREYEKARDDFITLQVKSGISPDDLFQAEFKMELAWERYKEATR